MRRQPTTSSTPPVWPPQIAPATLTERRNMKKAAQPEHSYTGYVPKWMQEPEDRDASVDAQQRQRNAPILGYSGHLRHQEDRIGTTFTRGLEIARQPVATPAGPLTKSSADHNRPSNNNQRHGGGGGGGGGQSPKRKQVTFQDPTNTKAAQVGATAHASRPMSKRSGYGAFDEASGYGDFAARPSSGGSGYGAFDGASGYGEFAAKSASMGGSGYGAFDGASGYGEFAAKPASGGSGYGAFDGASGYGEFAAKPMSARSGYGAFDAASGYGEFQAPPSRGRRGEDDGDKMSPRSAYGAFDDASGYGDFLAGPNGSTMSARSGYGEFDAASGYGAFQSRPEDDSGDSQAYGAFDGAGGSVEYGDFLSRGSGYGAFDNASGYGEFMAPPIAAQQKKPKQQKRPPIVVKASDELDRKYQIALRVVGGEPNARKLLDAFAVTVAQRHHKRTELLQAIKRSFEKHEHENQGRMTKAHVKEALLGLSCVFTDDQLMALMAVYDPECRGVVSMDALFTDLTRRAVS